MCEILNLLIEARKLMGNTADPEAYGNRVDEISVLFDEQGSDNEEVVRFFSLWRRCSALFGKIREYRATYKNLTLPEHYANADLESLKGKLTDLRAIMDELEPVLRQRANNESVLFGEPDLDTGGNCDMMEDTETDTSLDVDILEERLNCSPHEPYR